MHYGCRETACRQPLRGAERSIRRTIARHPRHARANPDKEQAEKRHRLVHLAKRGAPESRGGLEESAAREFAGQKVKVTGRVTGKSIRVTAIEAVT